MNRENEQQRPVSQNFCGALQKEANCKCLVLSVLMYGCLAAIIWCRCTNITKIVINFSKYPIKSMKHVSPCDDGYIYIPVAFMGMLYLVYLVECYHSPIRIDLLHAENQDSIIAKIAQLKLARPTIWWKAICYHYVRRKRQITRYRNGDNYTTTQVYYERVNTHAATTFYYYDYCGVKDISKNLILDPNIPITKIMLTKGFAFSNMRSATEFEEARSRFFAEQELRDDYMEMREGLDLGRGVNPTTLVAVLGNPWYINRYVYWFFSVLLLSWPLRVIIEYKTQFADYQVTKLFGVNYDAPSNGDSIQLHGGVSGQANRIGSYAMIPSYSEALLMDPVPPVFEMDENDLVPSYSEALLYERANVLAIGTRDDERQLKSESSSEIFHTPTGNEDSDDEMEIPVRPIVTSASVNRLEWNEENLDEIRSLKLDSTVRMKNIETLSTGRKENMKFISRDVSEPNLNSHLYRSIHGSMQFLRANAKSMDDILDKNETVISGEKTTSIFQKYQRKDLQDIDCPETSQGAIPKRTHPNGTRARITMNPIGSTSFFDVSTKGSTLLPFKSIFDQNKRRYTFVTTEEFENMIDREKIDSSNNFNPSRKSMIIDDDNDDFHRKHSHSMTNDNNLADSRRKSFSQSAYHFSKNNNDPSSRDQSIDQTSKILILTRQIEEVCPEDPFGGKNLIPTTVINKTLSEREGGNTKKLKSVPELLAQLKHSTTVDKDEETESRFKFGLRRINTLDTDPILYDRSKTRRYKNGISFPPYGGFVSKNQRNFLTDNNDTEVNTSFEETHEYSATSSYSKENVQSSSTCTMVDRSLNNDRSLITRSNLAEKNIKYNKSKLKLFRGNNLNMETSL